jgi:hypothetical protein
MGDHDVLSTCLSSIPHEFTIRDYMIHYFGCLRQNERSSFFDSLTLNQQEEIVYEGIRVRKLRNAIEGGSETSKLVASFTAELASWRRNGRLGKESSKDLGKDGDVRDLRGEELAGDDVGFGMDAHVIYYKDSSPYSHPSLRGSFPDQKVPVNDLFKDDPERNLLMRSCDEGMICHFHFPANNMSWVEV